MVGQRLKAYIESWGLEAQDVPKVVTVFVGAKYATLGGFIFVGARYQPLRQLFPRRIKNSSTWQRVKSFVKKPFSGVQDASEAEERAFREKWGGWYKWTAEKYWYLSDKMQGTLQRNKALSALVSRTGQDPTALMLGVAEGTILCKCTFPVWAPLELFIIMQAFRQQRSPSCPTPEGNLMQRYERAAAAMEDAQEMTSGPL
eukprot:TRINITY_DN77229_c0_g1_i1.p1 TRINITY_DN77229_c0_g1~~TRINITY_DN77229_c0_g1_i1.p1  ORF type:complete len:214 (+),score=44.30 TRINITY_DN77229_c0_g1_i1:42-644(+)